MWCWCKLEGVEKNNMVQVSLMIWRIMMWCWGWVEDVEKKNVVLVLA